MPLIGHWKLNEGAGTVVSDSSTGNHPGVVAVPFWTGGRDGTTALYFKSGINNYVDITGTAGLTAPLSAFSVSAWLKIPTFPINQPSDVAMSIFTQMGVGGFNTGQGWMLSYHANNYAVAGFKNTFSFYFETDGGNTYLGIRPDTQPLSQTGWYHLFASISGVQSTAGLPPIVDLYLNATNTGIIDQNLSNTITTGKLVNNSNLRIGANYETNEYASGVIIDDVRLYNHYFTPAEVSGLYLEFLGVSGTSNNYYFLKATPYGFYTKNGQFALFNK